HRLEADVVGHELVRVDLHLVRLQLAAVRVDLDDPGHRPQFEGDVPFEDGAQVHQGLTLATHLELIDLAQPTADGAHGWRAQPLGNGSPGDWQTLEDQPPHEIEIQALFEVDVDGGQPEAGHRSNVGNAGQAAHRGFDREGDEALHLQRTEPGGLRQYEHLVRCHIWHRVDWQPQHGADAKAHHDGRQHDDEELVAQREVNESMHEELPTSARRRCARAR